MCSLWKATGAQKKNMFTESSGKEELFSAQGERTWMAEEDRQTLRGVTIGAVDLFPKKQM